MTKKEQNIERELPEQELKLIYYISALCYYQQPTGDKLHYIQPTHTYIQHGQLTEMVTWAENWDFVGQLNKRKTHLARKDPASDTLSIVAEF